MTPDRRIALFASAARAFACQVADIGGDRWDGPGLGQWDLRSLVGHTSRSLTTVRTYLQTTAEREDIATAEEYYVRMKEVVRGIDSSAILDRGRQAGIDLGEDPAATVDGLVDRVLGEVAEAGDPLIQVIGGLGIRLHSYLPTRTFELAVHGLDIARATGLTFAPPEEVLAEAAALAARIGVAIGQGETVLLALTGRSALAETFSVV
ncbi:mycothiol maleylpyruvate isomerase [Mycolicibacterium sp. P9-64]|uniref:maleylpyruvate isomerase N-terminal domain-containing protein n=1 Tax=Mycolicibacterium sp. P9-64 TaxID=2024612 RepID=UPI0011ED8712|nr:maleylpyruvate isomerase N-terminal domain-containing protein [Mycolicibacterium sp. P9-64]KAA0082563.1 mycothiol maleylpyruvate isomerase [Mycolicibacterium sp. P9-64]